MFSIIAKKRCSKCKEYKALSEFVKDKSSSDGLSYHCRDCKDNYKHTEGTLEKARARARRWWENNKEKKRESSRKYVSKNPEKMKFLKSFWSLAHPDKCKEYGKRSSDNWRKNHPERVVERNNRRRAQIAGSDGVVTAQDWVDICNRYGNKCLCCGRSDVKLTIDHVVPLFVGGTHTVDNIQPLCKSCNSRKRTKTIDYR